MIIYNITITVESIIVNEWLIWMRKNHIPDVLQTGCFVNAKISKIISTQLDENTFAIAYKCRNIDDYNHYKEVHSDRLRREYMDLYGKNTILFRTMLEEIEDFNYCRKGF